MIFLKSLSKSQDEWKKEPKSYEFTYKILFNVEGMEKEKSKPEEKTEKNYHSMIKPNEVIENNEEIQTKISQFCLCV